MSENADEGALVPDSDPAVGAEPDAHTDPGPANRRLSSKASLIGLVVVGGALALLVGVQTWVSIEFIPGVATVEDLDVPGQKVSPALTLIALATLASALVLTIAGTAFRRVLGLLLGVLGAGLAAIGIVVTQSPIDGARAQIEIVTGISGDALYGLVDTAHLSPWPAVTAVVGIVIALTGLVIIIVSGKWKTGGRKYEAGKTASKSSGSAGAQGDRISDWEALSDGDDPTDYRE